MAGSLHRITVDCATGVVEVCIDGFWTAAHVAVFGRELRAAFQAVAAAGKEPVLLSDSIDAAIQSADVVAAMRGLGEELAPHPRKTALLTDGQLLRFQAKRIVAASTAIASFSDRDKAIAWLLADD